MTFEVLIAQGIRDTLEEKCAENRVHGKTHSFSLAYKIRRRSILDSRNNGMPLSIRKIRIILIAVILALFALTGFGLWRQLGGFSFNIFNDHSKVSYNADNFKTSIEEIYGLPEEYELLCISVEKYNVYSEYIVDGELVTINQYLFSDINQTNTENYKVEFLTINESDGYFIENIVDNDNYMAWTMDGYRFYLTGKVNKSIAINLVELLKIRNIDKNP